jgi:hypothetical protein
MLKHSREVSHIREATTEGTLTMVETPRREGMSTTAGSRSSVNDIETKAQTFRYQSYSNYRYESRTFQFVPKLYNLNRNVLAIFLSFKTTCISKFFYQFGTFLLAPSFSSIKTETFFYLNDIKTIQKRI